VVICFDHSFNRFLMAHSKDWPVLPWLKHDHPLQYEDGFDLGLRTALCGTRYYYIFFLH
jgi:hypothetical protein